MFFSAVLCVLALGICLAKEEIFSQKSDDQSWSAANGMQADKKGSEILEALMGKEDEMCYSRRCKSPDDCCKGSACVDIDGVTGTCLPRYGNDVPMLCNSDSDCEFGMVCAESGATTQPRTCQFENLSLRKKAYNDECMTSAECDTNRGLCCQVLRRHRMASRKACHYFVDPQSCIGRFETHMKPLHFIPNSFFKARLG